MASPAERFPAKGAQLRADRTVIVIGAFLFVIGLAVAWNGYGYVQLERGWTQVISGTFAGCTGLVLIALGLVLRELATIASSAARATLLLAKARTGLPAEASYAPPPAPAYAPPLEAFEEPAAEALAETPAPAEPSDPLQDSPLSWMVRANRTETSLQLKMPQAETSDAWLRHPLAARIEELAEQPVAPEPELLQETLAEAEPALEPPHEQLHEPLPLAPDEPALSPESFHESAFEHHHEPAAEIVPDREPEIAPAPEPEPEQEPDSVHEPAHEVHQEPPHESLQEPVAETVQESAEESTEELAPEPATAEPTEADEPKPAIIGHYDAQGAHYTLYADGSIEAETSHGVYRFASMAELKRFIEGQADGA
jgi:hypothetical protein